MSDSVRPAALLLTGGASRRLGRDKAMVLVGATTMAERTAALLVQVASPVIEVGPGRTGLVHVQEEPAGQGPLAAVAAGWEALIRAARTGPGSTDPPGLGRPREGCAGDGSPGGYPAGVLVVATDLPCLTLGLLRLLARHPGPGCLVPVDAAGRPQLLCARYPPAALRRAAQLLGQGRRAARDLLEGEEVTWLAPEAWLPAAGRPDALADVDTPADLARLVGHDAGLS